MIPVVVFTYNRPAQTRKVLEALRANKIPLLYVFADGPRAGDESKVQEVHKLIDSIQWTEAVIVKRPENIGLSESIRSGLSDVFKQHDAAIVVEDDIKVAPDFYSFMSAALSHYRSFDSVMGVTGLRYPFDFPKKSYNFDTFLYPRFCSWGWGTWKTKWQNLDWGRDNLIKRLEDEGAPLDLGGKDMRLTFGEYLSKKLSGCWDVDIAANMLLEDLMFVWPAHNMVENLGLLEGTHASDTLPPWELNYERRKLKGAYRFFEEFYLHPVIYASFIKFFQAITPDMEPALPVHRPLHRRVAGRVIRELKRK
jgi:hypothetical protein